MVTSRWMMIVVLVGLMVLVGRVGMAQMGGDNCFEAGVITENGTYPFDTSFASTDDPCFTSGRTVWFRYTAPAPGFLEVNLCGSTFNTYLTVYRGPVCPVVCSIFLENNNSCDGVNAALSFPVDPGETYHFAVNGFGANDFGRGLFNFNVTLEPVPAGDTCAEAGVIVANGTYEFDTTGASTDDPCFPFVPTVWFRFTAPANGFVEALLCGSSYNSYLTIFEGEACPVTCTSIFEDDDSCFGDAAIIFPVVAGQTYYLAINGSFSGDFGPGVLQFFFVIPGNGCFNAIEVTDDISLPFDTTDLATTDPCFISGRTIWYRYTAVTGGVIEADLCGSDFDTYLTVYEGPDCPITCPLGGPFRESNDDCDGLHGAVSFAAVAGQTYYFAVNGATGGEFGTGVFNFRRVQIGTGETCADAIVVSGNGLFAYDTTDHPEGTDPCFVTIRPAWFRFQAPEDGVVVASLDDTANEPFLRVFRGENCPVICANVAAADVPDLLPGGKMVVEVLGGDTYLFSCSFNSIFDTGPGVFNFRFIPSGGDITNDGVINVADVTSLGELLDMGVVLPLDIADFNDDGVVNREDLQALAEMIAN